VLPLRRAKAAGLAGNKAYKRLEDGMVKLRPKQPRLVDGAPERISVLLPRSPFIRDELQGLNHCLAAIDVQKLMEWWPGTPHVPHRDPEKVKSIQRSLDWKRVAQIAAYLLQREVLDAPNQIDRCFRGIYEPRKFDPGRQWPPKIPNVVQFERSEYPTFSNVLVHVNGAELIPIEGSENRAADLVLHTNKSLQVSVIDGQHRINGAYLAVHILNTPNGTAKWEIPCQIFLGLDKPGEPPRRQAQIFIDVNFYQKKVDRSLVADLFPTARGRDSFDDKERAQDLGRKLMLETGPLVGMIQIPGIKYGVKDVVTLATLNTAIEPLISTLYDQGLVDLDSQATFLAMCLEAWLAASGRREELIDEDKLDSRNVAYQGRVLVGFLTLVPACIWHLKRSSVQLISDEALDKLTAFLLGTMRRAGLIDGSQFIDKEQFKEKGYLGSGGAARFRNLLWASALNRSSVAEQDEENHERLSVHHHKRVEQDLARDD
jgi:DGQHR domain-containing protein